MADSGPPNSADGQPEPTKRLVEAEGAAPTNPETGQALVEYALILSLMTIVILVILQLVGPRIGSIFSRLTQIG